MIDRWQHGLAAFGELMTTVAVLQRHNGATDAPSWGTAPPVHPPERIAPPHRGATRHRRPAPLHPGPYVRV